MSTKEKDSEVKQSEAFGQEEGVKSGEQLKEERAQPQTTGFESSTSTGAPAEQKPDMQGPGGEE